MPAFTEIHFTDISNETSELLMALLNEIGFEGFEETGADLKAFIPSSSFDEVAVQQIASQHAITFTKTTIEETNWNEVWESNFDPIQVENFVAIRANFHQPVDSVMHEIIITPKMSFGTGHHATTFMMLQQMRGIDFEEKHVVDFGTGTGVLAILAEKLGAKRVLAIDNDDWSIENAKENIANNEAKIVEIIKLDTMGTSETFDIILANINKNVLMSNIKMMAAQLSSTGTILLSGILNEDLFDILEQSKKAGLQFIHKNEKSNWLVLKLSY